jgi:lactoylglutathione lyase
VSGGGGRAGVRIEHVALWTDDLERLRAFYEQHLGARGGERYENPANGFASTFLEFDGGARLELMQMADADGSFAHLALSLGSEAAVDAATERLRAAGVVVASEPRRTGDGYYESVVLDPDGNRIELTV